MRQLKTRAVAAFVGLSILFWPAEAGLAEPPPLGLSVPCRVVEVYDGDTLTVELRVRARVRLLDCWSPEVRGEQRPRGLKAREFVKGLALERSAVLFVPIENADRLGDVFTFGRVLGRVYVDGQELSPQIVAAGHATKERPKR